MSIIQSSRGKDQLLFDGFRYRRANNSQVTWRCVRNNCAGRVTSRDVEYIHLNDHNHAPNPDELISKQFKSIIDKRAETSNEPPRKIIHEALLDVHPGDASAVQNYRTVQRSVQRKRKKNDMPLSTPLSFENIIIPEELKLTNTGDKFLLYDNEKNDNRIIILSSSTDLNRLSISDHWHMDGTFKVSPKLFYQLYSIHSHFRGRSLPFLYAYLPGKAEHIYKEFFDIILQNIAKYPTSITIDFEGTVANVIKQKLPSTKITACFFHFKQNLWRKIRDVGLVQLFLHDREIRHQLKNFACLAFVPEQHVIEEFEKLEEESPESMNEFIDYFENNYIGRKVRNNRRHSPRFAISFWNCFDRLDLQLPRTNNPQEAWHNALQNSCRKHPTIYQSIHDLKTEQHANLIFAEKAEAGTIKIVKRALYEEIDEQLQNLTSLTGDARLARNKFISTSSEANQKLSITSYINLHLFDEPEKDELDDNDNEQSKINDNKLSTDNNDTFSFRNHHNKLNSLDNLSHRSLVTQSPTDTTRDIFTRRRALDPNEQHNLKTYIHHRKNSIVQHVIGYNYDDNSIVGGLYTRVGIGTREMIILLIMLDLSLWFEKTTTTTKHEANPFQLAFYHVIPWSIIAAIATPLQILFRFHASVCLSHVWANMYSLPTYEPVTPRDF
ncbi:unnamed protein product [Rotaria sordida]|uniref:MULE transposase domain-containing protein n=1 Tax=Rotaria sordida TaxID=392033 RepID=A0A819FTI0_9BILA|nr:unnamed protein product [Rotaria sordida]